MLRCQSYSCRELGQDCFQTSTQSQAHFYPPSKLHNPQLPHFRAGVFLGFSLHDQSMAKINHYNLLRALPPHPRVEIFVGSNSQKLNSRGSRVYIGFKLQCHSKTLAFPNRVNGKKKKYGGVLPSVLRSLESENDVERALNEIGENLSPKEQTVILKEQRSWERVIRVFEWFKSRKDYVPNVIHYNVVLRALGRAQKWDELRLCWIDMAKNSVFPTNNTYGMLVDVYGKAGLLKEALLWINHMRARGIFPDEVTMNTVVRVLKEGGEYERGHRFYKDWCIGRVELDDLDLDSMADGSGSDPVSFKHFLSTELFKTGGRFPNPKSPTPPSDHGDSIRKPQLTSTFNTLIDLYGKAGNLEEAANVFGEMLKSGVAMDTITFNTMIFTCGSHGHFPEAEALLAKMGEKRISPDTKTYNILLSLYAEAGDIDRALEYYRRIGEEGLHPDAVTHRSVLHILCQRNMVDDVERVIGDMKRSGARIDEHSVPGIVKMYVENGSIDKAKSFFEECQMNGAVRMSSKTYAAVIDAYAEKGMWAEAEAVFLGKRDLVGQKWNVVEYNVMVKAYGTAKLYDRAFALFKGMRNHGTWPDECTYNSLIQMFSKADMADPARELLREMQGTGFKPNCATFSAVIACHSRLGQLSEAVEVYRTMLSAGVKPNEAVYGALVDGFAESGCVEDALKYFRRMEDSGISANQIILTSLIKAYGKVGCLEGAKSLYDRMRGFKGGPDAVASNSMIHLYSVLGLVSEARSVFDDLVAKDLADEVSFATMMNMYKSTAMFEEAVLVAEQMRDSGLVKDCTSFTMVMSSYSAGGRLAGCGELLHEMLRRKILPDSWTFRVLSAVMKRGGVSIEAVTQLERSYEEGKPYSRQAVFASVFSAVGMHELAVKFCRIFADYGEANRLEPSAYNAAIFAYGGAGKTEEALNVFLKMQDDDVAPDIVTFINLVRCYGKAGMVGGVKRIYSQLKNGEIELNESLYKAIVDAYKTANRLDLADLATQEMKFALKPEGSEQLAGSGTEDEFEYNLSDSESS